MIFKTRSQEAGEDLEVVFHSVVHFPKQHDERLIGGLKCARALLHAHVQRLVGLAQLFLQTRACRDVVQHPA
jgi:hypothetical protein